MNRKRRISGAVVAALCLLQCGGELVSAASTEPIRNNDSSQQTLNPPDTCHPIYYPVGATSPVNEEAVAPEVLLRRFMERHTAMDYPVAVEFAMRLVDAAPDRAESHYNLACALSRLRRNSEALVALQKAADLGWRDAVHLEMDPDFANLRNEDRFKQIVAQVKSNVEAERITPSPLRKDAWQDVVAELNRDAPALLERYRVPGATVTLMRNGEIVQTLGFGVRDRRSADAIDNEDRFRVRAPLHLLAVIAGGQEQLAGRVEFAKLLFEGSELNPLRCDVDREQYLRARSAAGEVAPVSRDQRPARRTKSENQTRRPPSYSNSSVYGLLRLAIEINGSTEFPAYCEQSILSPLRLDNTTFTAPDRELAALATGHSRLGSPMEPDPKSDEAAAGGSVYTTSGDLARLMQAMIDLKQEGGMEPMFVQSIFHQVSKVEQIAQFGLGLALQIRQTNCGQLIEVSDESTGIGCLMCWYPAEGNGVVVLYNSATGREAAERLAHIALGGE